MPVSLLPPLEFVARYAYRKPASYHVGEGPVPKYHGRFQLLDSKPEPLNTRSFY
jgi:hypothetical protein